MDDILDDLFDLFDDSDDDLLFSYIQTDENEDDDYYIGVYDDIIFSNTHNEDNIQNAIKYIKKLSKDVVDDALDAFNISDIEMYLRNNKLKRILK